MNSLFLSSGPWSLESLRPALDVAAKAGGLIVMAWTLGRLLGRRRVLVRSALWNAVLVGLFLLPATAIGPRLTIPCLPAEDAPKSAGLPQPASIPGEVGPAGGPTESALDGPVATVAPASTPFDSPGPTVEAPSRPVDRAKAAVAIYFLGVALSLIRLARSLAAVGRLVRSGTPVDRPGWAEALARWRARLGIRGEVRLASSPRVGVPVVVGLRPTIVLPEALVDSATPAEVDAVLLHELSHVRRGDYGWNLALKLAQAIYWPHPLAWPMGREIADVRERACDDLCVHEGGGPESYRDVLIAVASALASRPGPAIGLAMARPSRLGKRLAEIAESRGRASCRLGTKARVAIGAVGASVAVLLGAVQLARVATATAPAPVEIVQDPPKPDDSKPKVDGPKPVVPVPQLPPALGADYSKTFEALVVDQADGKPIPGATVRFYTDPGEFRAITDKDGLARIPRPKREKYSFTADAWGPEHQSIRHRWSTTQPDYKPLTDRVKFALPKGELTISGRFVDEEGKPIPGVVLELQGMRQGEGYLAFFSVARVTDADGRWSSSAMPKNLSSIGGWVHHPDYYFANTGSPLDLARVKDGSQVTVLKRGARVEGRVVDENGRPIADAEIKLPQRQGASNDEGIRTDAEGRFVYHTAFAPGESKMLLAWAPGRSPVLRELKPEVGQKPIELTLPPGAKINGRAVDPSGQPVEGAWIVADRWSGWAWQKILTTTGPDGRFVLDGFPTDGVEVYVTSAGYEMAKLVVKPSDSEYTWTMGRRLSVQVVAKDSANGSLIKRFAIDEGRVGEDGAVNWEKQPANTRMVPVHMYGRGYANLDATVPKWKLRVRSQGYRDFVSREIGNGEGQAKLDVALEKLQPGEGGGPTGRVVGPDGQPLANAEVMLSTRDEGATLQNGSWWLGQGTLSWSGAGTVFTDDQGRFTFSPTAGEYSLGAVHELGYGELTELPPAPPRRAELANALAEGRDRVVAGEGVRLANPTPLEIRIKPWGRIEGRVVADGKPVPKVQVTYSGDEPIMMFAKMNAFGQATTDADGRFAFEKVPPGAVEVRYSAQRHLANRTFVDVPAGGTARAEVGGKGRPVVGRIAWPEGADSSRSLDKTSVGLSTDQEQIPYPKGQDYEEQVRWLRGWWTSREGIAHRHAYVLRGGEAAPDGSFRFDDVTPGDLIIKVNVNAVVDGRYLTVGKVERKFRMPEIPGGKSDEPLDLGTLTLEMQPLPKVLKVGQEAPDFEVKTLDGKPLKLADYRGKFVLLDFWATWCGPCIAQEPNLKAVHEAFAKDDRFALISLSLDDKEETVRAYLKKKEQAWTQGFLGKWADDPVTKAYGIESIPQILLIGPDGKVVARDLRDEAILATVRGALQAAK